MHLKMAQTGVMRMEKTAYFKQRLQHFLSASAYLKEVTAFPTPGTIVKVCFSLLNYSGY